MRIVSLCPSLTELVFDLGRGDDLVGITKFCVHPADKVPSMNKVGGTKDPKLDRIFDLKPDLVLMNEEENRLSDYEALNEAGIACHISFPKDSFETAEMVRSIGSAIERAKEAETIALDIEARTRRVREAAPGREPVRYAYLIWREPWMSVNDDTFAASLLNQAGGVNIFSGQSERYPSFEIAGLAGLQPNVVLLATEPFPFKEKHITELCELTGLLREQVVIADGEYLSWHGSRTPAGVDYAEEILSRTYGAVAD